MGAPSATTAVQRPGRGRVYDGIVDAIGDTPIVRLRKLPQAQGSYRTMLAAALQIGKRREAAGKTMLAIVPSFSERYLSTALFEGI